MKNGWKNCRNSVNEHHFMGKMKSFESCRLDESNYRSLVGLKGRIDVCRIQVESFNFQNNKNYSKAKLSTYICSQRKLNSKSHKCVVVPLNKQNRLEQPQELFAAYVQLTKCWRQPIPNRCTRHTATPVS